MPERLCVTTVMRCEMRNITADLDHLLATTGVRRGWEDGLLVVTSPHTTCGVTINEGWDPDVCRDMTAYLSLLVPEGWDFHHAEGNSDAHIKTSLFGASALVPVAGGRLALGQWQAVYLCESDGPRLRTLEVRFLRAE